MTVEGGAHGYVRIAAELIAATFRTTARMTPSGMTAVPMEAGDRFRPRRAAAVARSSSGA